MLSTGQFTSVFGPNTKMEQKLLQILKTLKNTQQFKQTHCQIITNGLQESTFIVPKLIFLSSNLISLNYAKTIFNNLNSSLKNVFTYNNMIQCFIGKESPNEAFFVYNQMRVFYVLPNSYTFTFLLKCLEKNFVGLKKGGSVQGQVVKFGFGSDIFFGNAILDYYGKCDEGLCLASKVFDEMPERDIVSWNTMIGAYMAKGDKEYAMDLFNSMRERNVVTWNSVICGLSKDGENMELASSVFAEMPERNEVSWNSMISGYIRAGDVANAELVFNQMPKKTVVSWTAMITGYTVTGDLEAAKRVFIEMPVKNVVSWNAMIACYVHNHVFNEALSLFHLMLVDGECKPDNSTLVSVLSACAHLGSLEHGKWIHSYIKQNKVELTNPLGNALIDVYAKCGDIKNAKEVFDHMPSRCVITWTTMVSGLAVHGQCREALELFDNMCLEGLEPDYVIFITVLFACTHGGFVEEGKRVFSQMVNDFRIVPRIEHYGCMVDLLGRAGKLEEAVNFIEKMDIEPNAVIWATLLGACKIHRNKDLLEIVTMKILDREPSNPGYLTLITNLSSSVGRWDKALSFRTLMRKPGMEKVPGCSSIQIGNSVHEFLAKDVRHKEREEIYGVLLNLSGQVKALSNLP